MSFCAWRSVHLLSTAPRALSALLLALFTLLPACSAGEPRSDAAPVERTGSVAQALTPSVREVTYNTSATVDLKPGDVIRLTNFPSGWAYSSVEINFDGATVPLGFVMSENNNAYTLAGWNKKIVVPYRRTATQDLVVTSGTGTARLVWWVSSSATTPADPVIPAEPPGVTPEIKDLGGMNAAVTFDGAGGVFSIKSFPSWSYNVVSVAIEPRDNQPLNGELHAGGVKTPLSGWYQKVMFKERGSVPLLFDLNFGSNRKVSLTWFVENRVPASKAVARSTSVNSGVVTATYGFAQDHDVQNDLTLAFNASDFSDGQVPTFTRLEHNPQGVRFPDRPDDLNGPTYDIHASLKAGKRVQVALPIPEIALLRGIDEQAITIMHYSDATKIWTEIVPDRIEGGYVYFTTDSFSSFYSRMWRKAKKVATNVAVAVGVVVAVVGVVVDPLVDGIKNLYNDIVSKFCRFLDFDTYKDLFVDQPRFQAPPPDLDDIVNSPDFDATQLTFGVATQLQLLDSAIYDGGRAARELARWEIAKQNANVLLADILVSRKNKTKRRFETRGTSPTAVIYDNQLGKSYALSDVFAFSSSLLASSPRVLTLVQKCDGTLGLADEFSQTAGHVVDFVKAASRVDLGDSCREVLGLPLDALNWVVPDVLTCAGEGTRFAAYWALAGLDDYWLGDNRDGHIIAPSEMLSVLSAVVWADPLMKDAFRSSVDQLRDEVVSYVGLTRDLYGNNNIMIKAMGGVALWDLVTRGDKTTYNRMKGWLEAKSGEQGGYAEGTGYLQYVNADVPYLMSAMVRSGLIDRSELPSKYLKSGEWLMNASHLRGAGGEGFERKPVEVDDGQTHTPDYYVYSYLTGDGRLRSFGRSNRLNNLLVGPISALGLTSKELPISKPATSLPDVYFADGVGIVRARAGASIATLAVVAESGTMRTAGGGHDQQDNGSVTLSHSSFDMIIMDRGYDGYGTRLHPETDLYSRFDQHNVVMRADDEANHHGEDPNGKLTYRDLADAFSHQPGVYNLGWANEGSGFADTANLLFSYLMGSRLTLELGASAFDESGWQQFESHSAALADQHAGGADADLVGPLVEDLPLHASHGLEIKHTSTGLSTYRRFLLSFGEHVWILDRPEVDRPLWQRLHFQPGQESKAFHYPAALAMDDQPLHLHQHDQPALDANRQVPGLDMMQRTWLGESIGVAPVFVTALRTNALTPPSITQVPCTGAVCFQTTSFNGATDVVIVPRWGQLFVDQISFLFQGKFKTGQIVLAHRDPGSTYWSIRLVGDQRADLAAISLGALTGNAQNVVYRLQDNGTFTASFPDGHVQAL